MDMLEDEDSSPKRTSGPLSSADIKNRKMAVPAAAPPPPKRAEVLEDLYAMYPEIGEETGTFLRVIRLAPMKSQSGIPISGFIEDIQQRMSMAEFKERYGGGQYSVHVLGARGSEGTVGVLNKIEGIVVPGIPIAFPGNDGEEPMSMNGPSRMQSQPMEAANVQMRRMDHESKQLERSENERRALQEQVLNSQRTPDHIVKAISDQARETTTEIKSLANEQVAMLREQNSNLLKELAKKDDELRTVRDKMVETRQFSIDAVRNAELALENRLKEAHKIATDVLREQFIRELSALKDQHNKEISENSRKYTEDLARRDSDSHRERERIARDADRSETNLRSTFEARINDLTRSTDRELATIREQRDREVASLKQNYDANDRYSKASTDLRITTLQDELARLRTSEDAFRRESEVLRKAAHKDPRTLLLETKELASGLLGMVDASEVAAAAAGDGEEKFDWKKEVAKGVALLLQKAPELAQQFTGRAQAAAGAANELAVRQQAQAQPRALAAQAQGQATRRRHTAPNPWKGGTMTPVATDIPFAPPIPARIFVNTKEEAQAAVAQPIQAQVASDLTQQQQLPSQELVPAEAAAAQPQASAFSSEQIEEGMRHFITQLEQAINSGIVPPEMFAKNFVQAVGIEQATGLLNQLPADRFLTMIEQLAGDRMTVITTRDGRQYVRLVWSEAAKMINSMASLSP